MAEKTIVKLSSKSLDETREFGSTHAEKLLAYQQRKHGISDWEIAEGEKFEFKDGAINPTGTGEDKKTTSPASNKPRS